MGEIQIRGLTPADWAPVLSIYLDGIATGQATLETRAPSWAEWDSAHLRAPRLVAASDKRILGWSALAPVSSRTVYAGVAEVSIYVAEASRGHGVGRALLEMLVTDSERNGTWTLQAGIFPENVASVRLHRSCGFRLVGTRERIGKMKGVWRDTLLFERRSKLVGTD